MSEIDWIVMMERMQDIRHFCSLCVRHSMKGGISSAQELDVLSRLELSEQPLTPQRLGMDMGISKPAVSRLIDGLEKKGLVCRKPSTVDKRSYLLTITPQGSAQVGSTYSYYLGPVYELRRRMGEESFAQLTDLIREANECMQDAAMDMKIENKE